MIWLSCIVRFSKYFTIFLDPNWINCLLRFKTWEGKPPFQANWINCHRGLVFVYLCLCICICVFVFVYLYLCICICVFVMRFERILHWKALGCLSGIDFLHSPLYNQSLLGVIINRGLNNWKQCEKTKENLLKWLSLVFSPSTERETLHWDTYQSMFWKTLKRNPTESTMFCICPVFSRMFQRLVWIQV